MRYLTEYVQNPGPTTPMEMKFGKVVADKVLLTAAVPLGCCCSHMTFIFNAL